MCHMWTLEWSALETWELTEALVMVTSQWTGHSLGACLGNCDYENVSPLECPEYVGSACGVCRWAAGPRDSRDCTQTSCMLVFWGEGPQTLHCFKLRWARPQREARVPAVSPELPRPRRLSPDPIRSPHWMIALAGLYVAILPTLKDALGHGSVKLVFGFNLEVMRTLLMVVHMQGSVGDP